MFTVRERLILIIVALASFLLVLVDFQIGAASTLNQPVAGGFLAELRQDSIHEDEADEIAQEEERIIKQPVKVEDSKIDVSHIDFNYKKWSAKQQIQVDFIKQHAVLAIQEQRKYNVPASITLAQAILESNSGKAYATKFNNYFQVKYNKRCFNPVFHEGAFKQKDDDYIYNGRITNITKIPLAARAFCKKVKVGFFQFKSKWYSFRFHSIMLTRGRYKKLLNHGKNYKGWAKGLKSCGYATSPQYAYHLIQIIEKYKLYRYDNV